MGTPVATSDDFATYLGVTLSGPDAARADLILELAQDLCESIVNPLPATARVKVIEIAARAWSNPQQHREAAIGSAHVTYGQLGNGGAIGGLYLSRSDKADLRRLAGVGLAFSVDTLPKGVSEQQLIEINASAGTFLLLFDGIPTSAIAYSPTAGQIQSALTAIGGIGAGNVVVSGVGPFLVTFTGRMAAMPVSLLTVDITNLTGSVTVSETQQGAFPAGSYQPPWNADFYNNRYFGSILP